MIDVTRLVGTVFSGLSALVIEDVEDAGGVICVRGGTRDRAVACPGCGTETSRVHGYHERTAADVPVGGRRVLVKVRVRRMRCPVTGCPRQTFREQVPGVLHRYQRRTTRLTAQVSAVARELAGRASARLLPALGIGVSRHAMLRVLLKIPLPALTVPRVLGIDDFALRRGSVYATVLIDAGTGRRVDVVQGRTADVAEKWLRDHPGVEVVCRDGSGAYGEAARQALPGAVQVSDRWHLWHGLGEAVRKEVAAHSACWARGTPLQEGKRAVTTLERWQQVHDLRARDVGLLDCARRADGAAPARPQVPPPPGRSPPRLPPQAPGRRARRPGPAAATGDPQTRLPGQLQPACPLHQPGPPGRRPAAPVTPPGRPDHAHQAGPPHSRPARAPLRPPRSLPRDDRPGQPHHVLRRPAGPRPG